MIQEENLKNIENNKFLYTDTFFSHKDYCFDNVEFISEEDNMDEPLLLEEVENTKFLDCDFDSVINIKNSSNIVFSDINMNLNKLEGYSDSIIFDNCTIKCDDVLWLLSSTNIVFNNCNIKGKVIHSHNSNIIFKNCNLKGLNVAINSKKSNITLKHTKIRNCETFLVSKESNIYVRLIELDKTTSEYMDIDNKTSLNTIATPKLFFSSI